MNFYPPPPVVTAEPYVEITKEYRCVGEETEWTQRTYHPVHGVFIEGPVADHDGNLLVVDIPFGRILKIDKDRKISVAVRYDGEPNGMAVRPNGKVVIADYKNGIMEFDPASGKVNPVLVRRNLERFKGTNDLCVDSNNNIYFTDQGQTGLTDPTGKVYRYTPEGKLDLLVDNGVSPNGLVLSNDEKILYVGMTRDNRVWRLPLHPDGTTTKVGAFFQAFGTVGPDGLAVDEEDNLLVCIPGLGTIFVVDKLGRPLKRIEMGVPESFPTNCTFGGPENKTLFITDSINGVIRKVDWHCRGGRCSSNPQVWHAK